MIEFNGPSISHQKGLSPFNMHAASSMFASFSGSWTSCSIQSWLAFWSPVSLQSSLSIWRPSNQRFSNTNARCDFEEFVVHSSLINSFNLMVRRMKKLMLNKRSCLKRIKMWKKNRLSFLFSGDWDQGCMSNWRQWPCSAMQPWWMLTSRWCHSGVKKIVTTHLVKQGLMLSLLLIGIFEVRRRLKTSCWRPTSFCSCLPTRRLNLKYWVSAIKPMVVLVVARGSLIAILNFNSTFDSFVN